MVTQRIIKAISYLQVILLFINPIEYREEVKVINDHQQNIYTLKIDMNSDEIDVTNALSYDVFYGFEKTSDIAVRIEGTAAVNGMFYDEYGYPMGQIVKDGKVISTHNTGKPSVIIGKEGQITLDYVDIYVDLKINGEKIELEGVNRAVNDGKFVLFDKSYGRTTRVSRKSINYKISHGKIIEILTTDLPMALKDSEYVLVHVTDKEAKYKVGDAVTIDYQYTNGIKNVEEAFQSGGWLVKDGKNICENWEPYIGNTNIPNPRTLIGVDDHNFMIVKVIDGRNDESYGVTGKESADLMIEEGCVRAVFLDGGASSTMVVEDKVTNNPSNKKERRVAHALVIKHLPKYNYQRPPNSSGL